jgi:uroporphyrin-III C-methyltransferase
MALAAAGIPFRIVPGVSAGVGGTASSGIPLTHRGVARTVTFATGQDGTGALADLGRVALSDVLVLYMAGLHFGTLAARLVQCGRDPSDAVALIQDATRPQQIVRVMTLADAVDQPVSVSPVMIVVGPVVALRDHLAAWQQTEPMTFVNLRQPTRIAG